jgi:membrane fusion protein, multidrug efflux system
VVSAAAMIRSAEAAVNAARLQVNNILPLVKKEIVTHTALEAAQYQLAEKEATLAQAKASLANAGTNIGYTTILSPVSGIVGAIPYKTGSLVSVQSPLPLLGFFARYPGNTVEEKLKHFPPVTLLLTDGTEYPEKGRIATVNGMIDKKTGSISFRATFPNPSGLLRSGGSATLQIPLDLPAALLLPQKATFEMQGKKLVFVVDEKNRVSSREVQVTAAGNGGNYIVQAGVQRGDRIVTDGMDNLRDSMIIKPIQQQHVKEIY